MDNNFNNNGFNGYQTDPYKQGSDASAQNVNTDKADGSQNMAQQSNYNPYVIKILFLILKLTFS